MPDIISIGEAMVELFSDEPIATTPSFRKAYGGDALNVLIAASRLGTSTGFITRVGDDPFRPFLLSEWEKESIDLSETVTIPGQNAIYFISLFGNGQREFTYYRRGSAASTLSPDDINEDYVARAKILHISGITQAISPNCREAVLAAVKMAKRHGLRVSYDPNLRLKLWPLAQAKEAFHEVLPYVDFLMPSEEEIAILLDSMIKHDHLLNHVLDLGVNSLIIKCGDRGCFVGGAGYSSLIEATTIDSVLDTTGAGDAFNGGFLHGVLEGMGLQQAARLGNTVAALKLRARGAIAGLPSAIEAYSRLKLTGREA